MNPLRALLAKSRRRPLRLYHDEAYRLPIAGIDVGPHAMETRRADDAVHYLLRSHAISDADIINPEPATYAELARTHTAEYLESLHDAETLAFIFAAQAHDVSVDELFRSLRLAVGGTIEAARFTVARRIPAINTLGGFHHAAPGRGAGFCALNDVAIAIAALRADGFRGRIGVIDLDFHPPDGTAACLGNDPSVWLGSVSGTDWGALPGVDEVLLPEGTADEAYLDGLLRLLGRMPPIELAFVLAGADVLTGDRLGRFSLSLAGIRQRELTVARRLSHLPQVWLPAGGYSPHAWKVLAGVGLALAFDSDEAIPVDADPLATRMTTISRSLRSESLGSAPFISEADVADALGVPRAGPLKLLEFYTAEGLEYALERYRVLPLLRRLGFRNLHIVLDVVGDYDRARLHGIDAVSGQAVVLIELEVERRLIGEHHFLFVNWLSLRNPRSHFSTTRPRLPGQDVPGLGLAREMAKMLMLMAKRLMLSGVAFRPSWFHMAWSARHDARFMNPERQGRFEALCRDVSRVPLVESTRAVAEGRVQLNGEPYAWEAEEMVQWLDPHDVPDDSTRIAAERERCHFTLPSLS